MNNTIVPLSYFLQEDVVQLAKGLLGKRIVTLRDGVAVSGIINETEAYAGIADKASHAYGDRCTKRTEVMYKSGGHIYVYLCYGIHALLNIVTHQAGIPHAILLRSIIAEKGEETMRARRKALPQAKGLTDGPGKVAQALGLSCADTGGLLGKPTATGIVVWLEEGMQIPNTIIQTTPRIGIEYAQEDKEKPWRFFVAPSKLSNLGF